MISPKLIDVEGNRIETTDTYEYKNGPKGNTFSVGNKPDGKRIEPVSMNINGRFPTQLFTNINEDKYKYIKIIKI